MTSQMTISEQAVHAALDKWRDHEFDGTLDNQWMRAALTAAALSSQPVADGPERRKFYRKHWELSKLLEARNGGLVDHNGGEAWRYEYTSKDENGEYDMLYRHNVNSSVPAHLPASPGASVEGLSAEQERLRFEGDLDKWMKIIGSGITGYQPEAYALMDLACEELVKLRADNKRLREALVMSEAAISELYRYQYSVVLAHHADKTERDGLWKAMHKARAALGEQSE